MVVFALAPLFKLSGLISPLISSSILGTYRPGEFTFQCPISLPFHTLHGVLKARMLKCFAIALFSLLQYPMCNQVSNEISMGNHFEETDHIYNMIYLHRVILPLGRGNKGKCLLDHNMKNPYNLLLLMVI